MTDADSARREDLIAAFRDIPVDDDDDVEPTSGSSIEEDLQPLDFAADEDDFDDGELLATLQVLNHVDPELPLATELPELLLDDLDDDPLLQPLDDIEHVFDQVLDDGPSNNTATAYAIGERDTEANVVDLLQQLGDLALDDDEPPSTTTNEPIMDFDDVPPYLYCQPCTPEDIQQELYKEATRLAQGDWNAGDWNASVRQTWQRRRDFPGWAGEDISEQDLEQLLQLSSLQISEPPKEQDPPQRPRTHKLSRRPHAMQAAKLFLETFDADWFATAVAAEQPTSSTEPPRRERACLGHRERILGLDLSECGRYIATASQESLARLWMAETNSLLTTLTHTTDAFECLRVAWASTEWGVDRLSRSAGPATQLVATGGADGRVVVWGCADGDLTRESHWQALVELHHATYQHFVAEDETDKPQVYALQFINHWQGLPQSDDQASNSFLLTSSDDHVHLWEIDAGKKSKDEEGATPKVHLREVLSLRFGDLHDPGYGTTLCQVTGSSSLDLPLSTQSNTSTTPTSSTFGGDRNPHNLVYVFDAAYCAANGLLGVALADGSLRLLNGRGICLTLLHLPGHQSHLTSFAWDSSGRCLATAVATGHLITWTVVVNEYEEPTTTCTAVLRGGHIDGRPLFGARYCGVDDSLLLSWGVDGRLCLWDAQSQDELDGPLAILLDKPDYPIYAVGLGHESVVVGGGGNDGGFIGIPVYVYDYPKEEEKRNESSKKARTQDKSSSI